ncbi:MAG: class I SAM-dependent methyltransferase [Burkholderiales bacterium]
MTRQPATRPEPCSIPCDLCGGSDVSVLATRSRSGAPLRTVICRACGLVWSDPRPHDARQFYETDYRVAYKGAYEPRPKHVLRAGKVALSRLEKIRSLLDGGRKRILDVGTGGGEFAYLLSKLGHDVRGIEPNRGYAEYSVREYGLAIDVGFMQDVALPAGSFDVITIWHALEHTESPSSVLDRLRRALGAGGALVVEVPNVEATCQSPTSTFHEAHLYNFNVASLRGAAEKVGLEETHHMISSDGGNVTMFLGRRPSGTDAPQGAPIPGNCARISGIVSRHTGLRHYATRHPYARAWGRLQRSLNEKREIAKLGGGRRLLDSLYSRALGTPG